MAEYIGSLKLPVNRLHIELTNACNFSCEFCPDSKMKRQRGIMPLELAKSILDDVSKLRIAGTVHFHVMGEPTLHPQLVDIVEYAGCRGVDTCLTTNGSRLDEKLLNELLRAGIGHVIISLQTPDERTFSLRGAKDLTFSDYAEKITMVANTFMQRSERSHMTISFLSSPLRRLIIPIFPEISIADTSADLKRYLNAWAERILVKSPLVVRYADVLKQIRKSGSFRENKIIITDRLFFKTRVLGDWSIHFDKKNVDAHFGYCPGLQENFGILWNGDYTFCCTDYDGKTSTHNYSETSISEYLTGEVVQEVVRGFKKFRVVHPYCRQCLGDRNVLNALVKQIGSIVYFKWIRNNH
jgi:sulfatase maturation enzyme AslB (radical SAM superfamily)